jgi:hypothetical protein
VTGAWARDGERAPQDVDDDEGDAGVEAAGVDDDDPPLAVDVEVLLSELPDDLPLSVEADVVAADESFVPPSFAAGFDDEYRSEYQPPPLRMKFVPPLMRRCAALAPHFGHTSKGASVMRCSSSHSCPHAAQAYS